ncbi:MAG: hypothetical protein PQJ61_01470 [Spirochaetales bacterium]|uniref:KDO2-lipid IV(A) lauroyltransferase n=1 Tax=Candidatus Thalassospirochaeta sargassi TaxID=3119039 RepID=A0AAJ1IC87_9SPIO|nr:hypothetical protein [Spirochaetales bacterium]
MSKFLQARINVAIFRFLPYYTSKSYLLFLGKIYYSFKKKEKKLIEKTVRHIYKNRLSTASLNKLVNDVFYGIFTHYHEKLFVAYSNYSLLKKRFVSWVRVKGEEDFRNLLAQNRGIILVTAHYGGVEWLPGALASRGYPVTMILRFQTQKLKRTLEKRAEEMKDLQLVDLDNGNVFFAAVDALKNGRILITECDEFEAWRPSKKIPINFMNQTFSGDKTLDIMRKHSGAAVATALMHRESSKRYTLRLQTVDTDSAGALPLGIQTMANLDHTLKDSPEQWYQWKDFGEKLELHLDDANELNSEYTGDMEGSAI